MVIAKKFEQRSILTVFLAFLAAVFFDCLFYGHSMGVSYPLFTLVCLGAFYWVHKDRLCLKPTFGWFLVIPILLLSFTFALYSNVILLSINFLLIPFLLVVHTNLVTDYTAKWDELKVLADFLNRFLVMALSNFSEPIRDTFAHLFPKSQEGKAPIGKGILLGLVIGVPVLAVILGLLTSADMVFSYYVGRVLDGISFGKIIAHSILILMVFFYLTGFLHSFHQKRKAAAAALEAPEAPEAPVPAEAALAKPYGVNPVMVITLLTLLDVVYILFSIVQFSFLYGGEHHTLPVSYSYSHYAREGFFQLLLVTVINLWMILMTFKLTNREWSGLFTAIKALCSLMVAFTLNMLFSSYFKVTLYSAFCGMTYRRFFVPVFIAMMLISLLVTLAWIWKENKIPLIKCYIVTALLFYLGLNFVEPDQRIIQYNVKFYAETKKVDMTFMAHMSYDTLPVLLKFVQDNPEVTGKYLEQAKQDTMFYSEEPLGAYLARVKEELQGDADWQSYNRSKAIGLKALAGTNKNTVLAIPKAGSQENGVKP